MVQSPTHIKILQAHSRGHFLKFFRKNLLGNFLAMHLRSRSLTFFNHIFVAQNRPADTKRHFWQPFWTQKSKTRSISDFLVQKVLLLRLFQRARHAVDLSTRKGKQPGEKTVDRGHSSKPTQEGEGIAQIQTPPLTLGGVR
jgi:hypothetical protein